MLDIFGTFEATVFAYYLGVTLVITLGMQSSYGLLKLVDKIKAQHQAHIDAKAKNADASSKEAKKAD
jgi:hypothetical protein